jgi:hypothetical protein
MQYRVFWAPYAEVKLEELIKTSTDAIVLAAAAREVDQNLMAAPKQFGESRYEAMRVGFGYPLGVQFEVMDDVRTVIVHDTWRIDRK